jgi:predicted nucleic acid-binding protein
MSTLYPQGPIHLVIDSNVIIAGLMGPAERGSPQPEHEEQYAKAKVYVPDGLMTGRYIAHIPRIAVVEICSSVRRNVRRNPQGRALVISKTMEQWAADGRIVEYDFDAASMQAAVQAAISYSTRGPDSVFVALAETLRYPLVTLDKDILAKYRAAVAPIVI